MDKKLTDSEVVKALECCKSDTALCNECPYDKIGECIEKMCADSIDLINRQKEEKEVLEARIGIYETCNARKDEAIKHLEAENEKYEAERQMADGYADALVEMTKAEAYKEFAELLHCQCESIINQPHNENVRPISWKVAYEEFDEKIDNLLKELVGNNETVL